MSWTFLCSEADIPLDGSVGIRLPEQRKDYGFVVRKTDGLFAWRNACPHLGYEGTTMAWKKNHYLDGDKQYIMCAAHGARFEIRTGEGVTAPCQGKALIAIDLKIDNEGHVFWHNDEDNIQ